MTLRTKKKTKAQMNDYYLITEETMNEEYNSEGEVTYYIKSRISKNGKDWEDCIIIWNGIKEDDKHGWT